MLQDSISIQLSLHRNQNFIHVAIKTMLMSSTKDYSTICDDSNLHKSSFELEKKNIESLL